MCLIPVWLMQQKGPNEMEKERVFSRLKPKQRLLTVVKSIWSLVAKPQNAKKI